MNNIRTIVLLILSVILVTAFSSCAAEKPEPVTVENVNVKIVYDGETIIDKPVNVTSEDGQPTVLMAVQRILDAYEIKYELSEDELSLWSVDDHAETDTGLWLWKVNNVEPGENDGRAGDFEIKSDDSIYFYFEDLGSGTTEA